MFLDPNRSIPRQQAELADQEQLRQERRALCLQELHERRIRLELERKEREARLVNGSWRERILLGMTLICFLCALGLMATGMQTGEPYAFGGSGTFGAMSSLLLHLLRAG
jgi:hypothetical protein